MQYRMLRVVFLRSQTAENADFAAWVIGDRDAFHTGR
jgi:hypothetical protein